VSSGVVGGGPSAWIASAASRIYTQGLRAIDAKLSSGSKAKPNKIVGQMLKKDATKIVLG
jgi:hypothetical protein